jgi:lipoprotein NlpI
MLKISDDRRVPMRQVYEMFKGDLKPADVLAAARVVAAGVGKPDKEQSRQLFYAHLYVGIYYDLEGDTASALSHLTKAAGDYRISHYMGDVALVHRDVLLKRSKE